MHTRLSSGTRLKSVVCETEIVVIHAPSQAVLPEGGGHVMGSESTGAPSVGGAPLAVKETKKLPSADKSRPGARSL